MSPLTTAMEEQVNGETMQHIRDFEENKEQPERDRATSRVNNVCSRPAPRTEDNSLKIRSPFFHLFKQK